MSTLYLIWMQVRQTTQFNYGVTNYAGLITQFADLESFQRTKDWCVKPAPKSMKKIGYLTVVRSILGRRSGYLWKISNAYRPAKVFVPL